MKETSYSDHTRDLFNTLPTQPNTRLSPLLSFCLTCFLSASVTRKDLQFGTWTDSSWSVHVPNCKSFLVTEAERKHVKQKLSNGLRSVLSFVRSVLTLILLTWRICWAPNNAKKWQMGFNSACKGLNKSRVWSLQLRSFMVGLRTYQQRHYRFRPTTSRNISG